MLFIQILIIAFVFLVVMKTTLGFKKRIVPLKGLLFWLGLWLVVLIVSLLPQVTVFLAKILGISRGTDVAIYFSILFVFFAIFKIITKQEKIDRKITEIVSYLALKNSDKK